ncbi:MAG: hypothetical protein LBG43_07380 [Treponema sp.]|jgi:hypothetical protein|nr:hypothetical protein [Treponema sp.]
MNIEITIKRAFEKEIEQCQTPEYPGVAIPVHTRKRKKEGYGSLLLCLLMTSALALFSLKTGNCSRAKNK